MNDIRITTILSQGGRRILGRLFPGTDLISGVKEMCRQANVSCGTVSIIGSLRMAEFIYAVPDESTKLGTRMTNIKIGGPLELLSCQGVVGETQEGELSIHLHGVVVDAEMKLYGGHFMPNNSPILGTGEIVIHESSDCQIIVQLDEEIEFPVHHYYSRANQQMNNSNKVIGK